MTVTRSIPGVPPAPSDIRAVQELAAELTARHLRVLFAALHSQPPRLTVTASQLPHATGVAVMARDGWFWWPWKEGIAPVAEVAKAADLVAAKVTERRRQ